MGVQMQNMSDRFWLTQAGCEASGGHRVHDDNACRTCVCCGTVLGVDGRPLVEEVPC